MSEINKSTTTIPQIKMKPIRQLTLINQNEETTTNHPTVSGELKSLSAVFTPADSMEDNPYDFTFELLESIYDLPGFEHFNFDGINIDNETEISLPDKGAIEIKTIDKPEDEVKLAPSSKLIQEIFNTSTWRNSCNYEDDFIYAPSLDSNVTVNSDTIQQSPLSMDDRRKTQSSGRRSIFSSIFKSKKGQKKSAEKIPVKDNSDNDSLQEFGDKNKSNNKNTNTDVDSNKSANHDTKKPLNSIFNRDWLNTIGDGVTKKATVMSELRKLFHHGKFKNFRKVTLKNSYDISKEMNT